MTSVIGDHDVVNYNVIAQVHEKAFFLRDLKVGEYRADIGQFQLGPIQSREACRPIACERKYLMDYNY